MIDLQTENRSVWDTVRTAAARLSAVKKDRAGQAYNGAEYGIVTRRDVNILCAREFDFICTSY